ncbi:hypothetical protein COY32_05520 [candidate division WWE3 bacterium CG_4_10_14_0_2_um_filter_41_14]|uniref:Uncharacterized protein n=1 Tax=candidate division WWE3 bacterium CG_4_10_14_0_2_um_filter_41_14 TaxID=1975072 RepID=A0A2M7TGR9_UNCKA|nr:MAG: hypothetical protein COY32_05520 [candidate division WWE3 bacterium CG_4_10_14_0_2_um_filter_41_14]
MKYRTLPKVVRPLFARGKTVGVWAGPIPEDDDLGEFSWFVRSGDLPQLSPITTVIENVIRYGGGWFDHSGKYPFSQEEGRRVFQVYNLVPGNLYQPVWYEWQHTARVAIRKNCQLCGVNPAQPRQDGWFCEDCLKQWGCE